MKYLAFRDICAGCSFVAVATAVVLLCATVASSVREIPGIVTNEIEGARADLRAEIRGATVAAAGEIDVTRIAAVLEIAKTRAALVAEVQATRDDLGAISVAGLRLADHHLASLDDTLDTTNLILARTAEPIAKIADQVNDAAPLFLDCDHNPDCLFNRYVGFARGAEQAAEAIGKAAPAMTQNAADIEKHVDKISADVQRFADNATKPKTKAQKAWDAIWPLVLIASRFM